MTSLGTWRWGPRRCRVGGVSRRTSLRLKGHWLSFGSLLGCVRCWSDGLLGELEVERLRRSAFGGRFCRCCFLLAMLRGLA